MVKVPVAISLAPPSSVTAPVSTPPMTAASSAPLMVMVTWWVVASTDDTVMVSIRVSPAMSALMAGWSLSAS
jgi:hypothetical protein